MSKALIAMGQSPTDEELFVMIHDVDEDNSGEIEFSEFCKVIMKHKAATSRNSSEGDTLDAFVALGGNAFELTLDIDRLVREVDFDRSGYLDWKEFTAIMG
eukprot:gene3563-3831_t